MSKKPYKCPKCGEREKIGWHSLTTHWLCYKCGAKWS